jgi:hypothetical protein
MIRTRMSATRAMMEFRSRRPLALLNTRLFARKGMGSYLSSGFEPSQHKTEPRLNV